MEQFDTDEDDFCDCGEELDGFGNCPLCDYDEEEDEDA